MSNKIKNLTVLFVCLAMGLTASTALAKKNACGKEMSAVEMAERALAIHEIQYVMGLHQLYGAPGGDHDKEIELIWAHKTPDVSFASNRGVYRGDIDVIYSYYGSGSRKAGKKEEKSDAPQMMMGGGPGVTSVRLLTTPIIQIAGDMKTAKAWWYTPGHQSNVRDGKGNAIWTYEKYGIDFVNEDGEWKIWHFHVYNDWDIPMGEDLVEYTVKKEKNAQEMPPRAPREDLAPYYTDKVFGESYSLSREANPLKPRPPVPYCTFSETFSYADE
jgi:hypothetical protein